MTGSASTEEPTDDSVKQLSRKEFQRLLMGLTPQEFEHFVADLWNLVRPGTPEVTKLSGDMGVDVSITDGLEREMIQVKRYNRTNTVGRPEIQQYYALYDQEIADRVTVVTSGTFTQNAESWAATHGVTLYDYNDLYDLFQAADLSDLLSKWFIEGRYELNDSVFPALSRLVAALRRAVASITGLPALITRLGRPVFAVATALGMGLLVVAGVATVLVETAPAVAERSDSAAPSTGVAALTASLLVGLAPVLLSLSLALQRRWWRTLLAFGGFMAAMALLASAVSPGDTAFLGAALTSLLVLALAVEDLYRLVTTGVSDHYRRAIRLYLDRFLNDEGESTDEPTRRQTINPLEYATVAARQRS